MRCANFQNASLKKANLTNANLSKYKKDEGATVFELAPLRLNDAAHPVTIFDIISNLVTTSILSALSGKNTVGGIGLKYSLESNLTGANFTGSNLTDVNLSNANLTDINLSNAILDNTKLSKNNLSNASFINTDVSEVDFKKPISICEAIFSNESIYEEHCQEEEKEEKKSKNLSAKL